MTNSAKNVASSLLFPMNISSIANGDVDPRRQHRATRGHRPESDGGATWVSVAVGVPSLNPTTGSWTGSLPAVVSAQALVRVSAAATPTDADVSNVAFTLAPPALALTAPISNVSWGVHVRVIRLTHNLWSRGACPHRCEP